MRHRCYPDGDGHDIVTNRHNSPHRLIAQSAVFLFRILKRNTADWAIRRWGLLLNLRYSFSRYGNLLYNEINPMAGNRNTPTIYPKPMYPLKLPNSSLGRTTNSNIMLIANHPIYSNMVNTKREQNGSSADLHPILFLRWYMLMYVYSQSVIGRLNIICPQQSYTCSRAR